MRRRNRPRPDQPLLPLADTVRPASDLDREVEQFRQEARREPIEGQRDLPIAEEPAANPDDELTGTEWAEKHLNGAMTYEDDEPWTEEELRWAKDHPGEFEGGMT